MDTLPVISSFPFRFRHTGSLRLCGRIRAFILRHRALFRRDDGYWLYANGAWFNADFGVWEGGHQRMVAGVFHPCRHFGHDDAKVRIARQRAIPTEATAVGTVGTTVQLLPVVELIAV